MFSVQAISLLVYQAAEMVSRRAKARKQIKLETMLALASEQAKEAKRQKLNCSAVAENLSNKSRDENWFPSNCHKNPSVCPSSRTQPSLLIG